MKKLLIKGVIFLSLFLVMGCQQNNSDSATVQNNLSESQGTDEVEGSYASSSGSVVFDDGQATVYSGEISSSRAAAAVKISTYNYSYNSEDKTIEIQLDSLWDENEAAIAYNDQVKAVKANCESLASTIKSKIGENDTLATFISTLNTTKDTYGDTVLANIKTKAATYVDAQLENLNDYLESKYSSVIKMSYTITDGTLKLCQQFQDDLTDASSEFTSSDSYAVILNGYDSLKPFSITVGETEYVGVPVIDGSNLTVDLYEYPGDISDADELATIAAAKAVEICTYITEKYAELLTDTTEFTAFSAELLAGKTTTIDSWIDDIFGSLTLKATVSVEDNVLTLTTTQAFETPDATLASGTEITLNYYPVLSDYIDNKELTALE